MKQLAINRLHRGDAFTVAGHEYIALDHIGGGVLAVQSNTLDDCMPFGKTNDWRKSRIREYLNGEYLEQLVENGIDADRDLLPFVIDLKETNGGREYGFDTCKVGVLTLAQYFNYNEHLPLTDEAWWTATPWGTPKGRSPSAAGTYNAWHILTSGGGNGWSTSSASVGVRPALIFSSSLLVSVETEMPDTCTGPLDDIGDRVAEKVVAALSEKLRGAL